MRNREPQPQYLDLAPVDTTPIRIFGQLIGPMRRPDAGVKILLKAITTSQIIVQDTWSQQTTDQNGNYDFSVQPGKYAVFFERSGKQQRVNNIQVYSDSTAGPLQTFMLSPAPEQLTPLVVKEVEAIQQLTTAAMLRSRQWAENPVDEMVLDIDNPGHDPWGPGWSAMHYAHMAMNILDTDTNINWLKEWNASTAYKHRDAVRWRPDENTAYSSYYCMEDNTNVTPPTIDVGDNAAWSLMAAGGSNGEASTVPGPTNTLTIGTVTAVPSGTPPSATITGDAPNQVLNLSLETGAPGDASTIPGPANSLRIGAVTSVPYGTPPSATITGEAPNQTLNLSLETGAPGSGDGGVVEPGAVGAWALMDNDDPVFYTIGQTVSASNLHFAMIRLMSPGPEWQITETVQQPSGTWRVASDVGTSGYPYGTFFLAQRIA